MKTKWGIGTRMVVLSSLITIFTSNSYGYNSEPPATAQNKTHIKGIYLTQYTLENTAFLTHLITHAKLSGIDTFVVDLEKPDKRYETNIAMLKANNIHYVARIIMFPGGGTPAMIQNPAVWQRKYALVKQAVAWGAQEIQLDYIRYNTKQKASPQNAQDVLTIISWYKNQLRDQHIPLQIDVFGITSFGESKYIGQNIKLFSQTVDVICPMVYPSHYVPFPEHFQHPFETIYVSLQHIKGQFQDRQLPMKIYAYIELSNYHYPMSHEKTLAYIQAQMRAVSAAGADGWYAWSPHNRYDNLFYILENKLLSKTPQTTEQAFMDKTDKIVNKKLAQPQTAEQKTIDKKSAENLQTHDTADNISYSIFTDDGK